MIKFQNQIEKPKKGSKPYKKSFENRRLFFKNRFRKLGSCFGDHLRIGEVHVLRSKHKTTCVGVLERL